MSWLGGSLNGNNTAFHFTVDIANAPQNMKLQSLNSSSISSQDVLIDWGDGSTPETWHAAAGNTGNTQTALDHSYTSNGTYDVRIWDQSFDHTQSGSFSLGPIGMPGRTGINGTGSTQADVATNTFKSHGLMRAGDNNWGRKLFRNERVTWDTANVENYPIQHMARSSNISWIWGHLESSFNWDTAAENPSSGRPFLLFNTPGVGPTSAEGTFRFNANFNPIANWELGRLGAAKQMLRGNSGFVGHGSDGWDVSNISDMDLFLEWSDVFNTDVGSWDVSNVSVSMRNMFKDNFALDQDLSAWWNTGGGMPTTNLSGMFDNAGLSDANYSKWLIGAANYRDANTSASAKSLGAAGCKYDSNTYTGIGNGTFTDAPAARTYLTGLGWTISDAGAA